MLAGKNRQAAGNGVITRVEQAAPSSALRRVTLAVKPREDDAFLREVDEELRREQLSSIFARYGWWIIGGAVFLLVALAAGIWWNHRQDVKAGEQSEKLVQAIEQVEANNARGASATIDELAASDRAGEPSAPDPRRLRDRFATAVWGAAVRHPGARVGSVAQ